ncbi:MAG: thioredoxin domain-containing protein [Polyangiaceae bacterium]|nr:thioredoxin domain-containing protein [Polyangiaceae bacterium]
MPTPTTNLKNQIILSTLTLQHLVNEHDTTATFEATNTADSSPYTVTICTNLTAEPHQQTHLQSTFQRIARHAVGIRALAKPIAAGFVNIDGTPRLAIAHAGSPSRFLGVNRDPAPVDEVVRLLKPIAETIGALHDQGITHGAVFRSTLRFDSDSGNLILSAFGLVELAATIGGPAAIRDLISHEHLPPELRADSPSSPCPRTDTFGLALVATEQLVAAGFRYPISVEELQAIGLSDPVAKVLSRGISDDPWNRFDDPRAFIRELESAICHRQVPDSPKPQTPPIPIAPVDSQQVQDQPTPTDVGQTQPQQPLQQHQPRVEPAKRRASQFVPPRLDEPTKTKSVARSIYAIVAIVSLLVFGLLILSYIAIAPGLPVAESEKELDIELDTTAIGAGAGTVPPLAPPLAEMPEGTAPPLDTSLNPSLPPPPCFDCDSDGNIGDLYPGGNLDAFRHPPESWVFPDFTTAAYPNDAKALVPVHDDTVIVGTRTAPVTIVLFADVTCYHSLIAAATVRRIIEQPNPKIRLSLRFLPIADDDAFDSAEVAAAILGVYGGRKFWEEFWYILYLEGPRTQSKLLEWASDRGMDETKLAAALSTGRYADRVKRDINLAGQLMIRETPTYIVNGKVFAGPTAPELLLATVNAEGSKRADSWMDNDDWYATRVRANIIDNTPTGK